MNVQRFSLPGAHAATLGSPQSVLIIALGLTGCALEHRDGSGSPQVGVAVAGDDPGDDGALNYVLQHGLTDNAYGRCTATAPDGTSHDAEIGLITPGSTLLCTTQLMHAVSFFSTQSDDFVEDWCTRSQLLPEQAFLDKGSDMHVSWSWQSPQPVDTSWTITGTVIVTEPFQFHAVTLEVPTKTLELRRNPTRILCSALFAH